MNHGPVYLTSFRRSGALPRGVKPWSAAVYQPRGFDFEKAECWDIRDETGSWTRPRDFIRHPTPLAMYRNALWDLYGTRRDDILKWLRGFAAVPAALCCWCPYDRAAQRQLDEFGSFVCHLTVVGEFLSKEFNVPVWYDRDRVEAAVLR